jgi:aminoglycoside phosphotransferase (APT) family kinase protein
MTPDDPELRLALERAAGGPGRLVGVRRRPSAYRTSSPIEELDVQRADGTTVPLILKVLGRAALTDAARKAKPAFLDDPAREVEVYQSMLPAAPPGPPKCYGAGAADRCWVLLERVAGRELYQVGEFELWEAAARWLARLHATFAGRPGPPVGRLVVHDPDYFRAWARRAAVFVPQMRRLSERYERAVERLAAVPPTVLHGEFYASNVLVCDTPVGVRVCPVDWELAGWGPGPIDLAALTAGKWTDAERRALAAAYHDELGAGSFDSLLEALEWCRLHQAVRWVGWSADWAPPAGHAHDWVCEALELADRLGVG